MNAKAIAQLRADSLSATLSAARQRRVRRHGVAVLGGVAALIAIAIAVLPMRKPTRTFISNSTGATAEIEMALPKAESRVLIRTSPRSVVRISTVADISHIRVTTAAEMSVERIDRTDLRAWFPEQGIAFIGEETGPPRFVVF